MVNRKRLPALALLAAALLPLLSASACGGDRGVLAFAAASLRDALTALGRDYESEGGVGVSFNLGGSVALSQQLRRGSPGDLFISAGAGPMDALERAGLLASGSRTTLLTNRLAVVIPSAAEDRGSSLSETLAGSQRVVIADPSLSPAGRYAQEALRALGLWDAIQPKLVFGGDARAALAYVESRSVDAGVVYVTDALHSDGARIAHEIPAGSHTPIVYPAAVLKDSPRREAALRFLAFLQQEPAQAHFRAGGFGTPELSRP